MGEEAEYSSTASNVQGLSCQHPGARWRAGSLLECRQLLAAAVKQQSCGDKCVPKRPPTPRLLRKRSRAGRRAGGVWERGDITLNAECRNPSCHTAHVTCH